MTLLTLAAWLSGVAAPSGASAAPPADNAFPVVGETRNSSCVDGFGDPRAGHTHQGNDCFAGLDRPLIAVEDGVIRYAISEPAGCGSGNRVSLRGASGYRYYYGHLNTINVVEGQPVRKGDLIGTMGQTGNANPACGGGGVHLHFEIAWADDPAQDPWPLMATWQSWAAPGKALEGFFDLAAVSGADVRVAGWAFQKSSPTTTTSIEIRTNETSFSRATGVPRPDVVAAYALPSTARPGFDTTLPLPGPGSYRICVSALAGSNSLSLGCKTVTRAATTLSSGLRYLPVTPTRIVDTTVSVGQTVPLDISGATTAKAVSATFTAVAPSGPGFLTVWQCGRRPEVSTSNFTTGVTKASQAIVPMDAAGNICLYASATTRVIIDVNGWMRSDSGHLFNPTAFRRGDTRAGQLGGRLSAGATRTVSIAGVSGVPGSTATNAPRATTLNLTVINPGAAGYLTVWNCVTARPTASSLNYTTGATVSASISSDLSSTGNVCVYSSAATDLVVDVQGWYGSTGKTYRSIQLTRLVDTRSTNPARTAGTNGNAVAAGGTIRYDVGGAVGIPTGAAAAFNAVTVQHGSPGFVTTWDCAATRPGVSHLNYSTSPANNNSAQVAVNAAGELCSYTLAATHMIVDVSGMWQ